MTIPVEIEGTDQHGRTARVALREHDGEMGLVVFTDALHDWTPIFLPAFNDDFGVEMAQDFAFGGSPVKVHDGIDAVLWTGSSITGGKFQFSNTDRFHSGIRSVRTDNASVGDVAQFDKGSIIDLTNYVALTMYINVDKDWKGGDSISIYGWDTATNLIVGNQVFLEDYFNETEFDEWHKVTIPFVDMGIATSSIYAFRMQIISKEGKSPKFYIDDFQVEELGVPQVFYLKPREGTVIEIHQLAFSITAALDTRLLNATTLNLSYDKFMNLAALDNGLLFQRVANSEVIFGQVIKTIGAALRGGASIKNIISDGTNTQLTIETDFGSPLLLDSRTNDSMNFILSDDLSGLITMSVLYKGRERSAN